MMIEVMRPNPGYPMVWVRAYGISKRKLVDLSDILTNRRITLLGPWEEVTAAQFGGTRGVWGSFRAPGLLEDEHVKPRKKSRTKNN